jgi:hypothetical protein
MKRWTIRIFVFMLLGAIVNVAVAWALLSLRYDTWSGDSEDDLLGYWPEHEPVEDVLTQSAWGVCEVEVHHFDFTNVLLTHESVGTKAVPHWCCVRHLPRNWTDGPDWYSDTYFDTAWGWPTLSLHSCTQYGHVWNAAGDDTEAEPVRTHGGVLTGWLDGDSWRRDYALPLIPIWPGFAINTVFYAAVLWMLFAAPFALRKWRRIRRGLCPKCGYDLRNRPMDAAVCPECGAEVRSCQDRLVA